MTTRVTARARATRKVRCLAKNLAVCLANPCRNLALRRCTTLVFLPGGSSDKDKPKKDGDDDDDDDDDRLALV